MNKKAVTVKADDIIALLKRDIATLGTARAVAAEIGLSESFISDVLTRKRSLGNRIAAHYGYRSETRYILQDTGNTE